MPLSISGFSHPPIVAQRDNKEGARSDFPRKLAKRKLQQRREMGHRGIAKPARAPAYFQATTRMLRRLHGRFLRYQVPQLRRPHVFSPGNPQLRMRVLRDERALGRRRGGARFHREVPPPAPSSGKRPDQAASSVAPRTPEGIRLVLLQALLAQHVPRRVDLKRGPRNRRRVRARNDREHPLPVLRRGIRGRVDPERVRVPVVREQDRRHRPDATRHVQQAPVHRNGLGVHPRPGNSLPHIRAAGARKRPRARAAAPRPLRGTQRRGRHRQPDGSRVYRGIAC